MPPPERSARRLRAAALLLVCGLLPTVVPLGAAPAGASSVYLCTGYRGCAQVGLSDGGYGPANSQMYWRMYSGHNCTNYVAYRLIQAGMSPERPWDGTGMAYNWGHAMSDITDKVPTVGAVAWWDRGASGVSSSGHVAIVEKVVSPTEIIVSEDSWGGDFSWRRIIKDGTSWPTGFIHFVDQTVTNTVAPQVTGTPQVGETLRLAKGRWKPAPEYSFQWLADLRPIAGATGQTLTLGPEHLGAAISARVTASAPDHTPGVIDTPAIAPVVKGALVSTAPPVVSGDAELDAVLTATPGAWSATPDTTLYRWRSDGEAISGASSNQLTLTRAMVGTTITAVEVARRAGFVNGSAAAAPGAIGPVLMGTIVATPVTAAGRNRYGAELRVDPGTTDPADVTTTYAWLRDGVPIPGATGPTYAPTEADVGRTVDARVTYAKPRYDPLVSTHSFGRTTTPTTLVVRATGRKGKAAVRVVATAAGAQPTGPVTVRIGSAIRTVDLVSGSARVVLDGLRAGGRTVKVVYVGDGVARRGRGSAEVTIKKPRRQAESPRG